MLPTTHPARWPCQILAQVHPTASEQAVQDILLHESVYMPCKTPQLQQDRLPNPTLIFAWYHHICAHNPQSQAILGTLKERPANNVTASSQRPGTLLVPACQMQLDYGMSCLRALIGMTESQPFCPAAKQPPIRPRACLPCCTNTTPPVAPLSRRIRVLHSLTTSPQLPRHGQSVPIGQMPWSTSKAQMVHPSTYPSHITGGREQAETFPCCGQSPGQSHS